MFSKLMVIITNGYASLGILDKSILNTAHMVKLDLGGISFILIKKVSGVIFPRRGAYGVKRSTQGETEGIGSI